MEIAVVPDFFFFSPLCRVTALCSLPLLSKRKLEPVLFFPPRLVLDKRDSVLLRAEGGSSPFRPSFPSPDIAARRSRPLLPPPSRGIVFSFFFLGHKKGAVFFLLFPPSPRPILYPFFWRRTLPMEALPHLGVMHPSPPRSNPTRGNAPLLPWRRLELDLPSQPQKNTPQIALMLSPPPFVQEARTIFFSFSFFLAGTGGPRVFFFLSRSGRIRRHSVRPLLLPSFPPPYALTSKPRFLGRESPSFFLRGGPDQRFLRSGGVHEVGGRLFFLFFFRVHGDGAVLSLLLVEDRGRFDCGRTHSSFTTCIPCVFPFLAEHTPAFR